ncbi:MAG: hypothetical protein HC819_17580 [Cyclobacteriaceae bacterium]|nr:hypothetical protein [Cyclobacteriaceae bacterium]
MTITIKPRTKAQESRAAIERLYIIMRHLFIRGSYKPMGVSGSSIIKSLLTLNPEIYGSIADEEKVEIDGLLYVIDRLPQGIEECRQINLISREGYEHSNFKVIIPAKRRRNCYRVDREQIFIELTRGRSDIYDILTHLTFIYIEAEKIKRHAIDYKGRKTLAWKKLEEIIALEDQEQEHSQEQGFAHLSVLMGRTYEETALGYRKFEKQSGANSLFHIVYWLGRLAIEEASTDQAREITFSATLRERIGHHTYGELWANKIKKYLYENQLLDRPLHIISANMHSFVNSIYAFSVLSDSKKREHIGQLAELLSDRKNVKSQLDVIQFAQQHGLAEIEDTSGTNITVQIIDTVKFPIGQLSPELVIDHHKLEREKPVLLIMDYAFGEQAYETMDELLKRFELEDGTAIPINVHSISVMGKAGILGGSKGDIMVPTAHVFEGTADNYPIENDLKKADFADLGINVVEGTMVSVLGTSLQNVDVLEYFLKSSWKAIGLEMEGAHYQKAIQSASKIRRSISSDVKLRYAYYASDNPLLSNNTLASGSLGLEGVKSTYAISIKILNKIFA